MTEFYGWLTVAPLGDGAFLKASRTADLYSLGGWSIASSIRLFSSTWMILFCSGNKLSVIKKQWNFHQQTFYLPNPTDLTFFLHQSALGLANSLTIFYSFWKQKSNLVLLLISSWIQIKQLDPYYSLPNILSIGIKLSNRLSFSKFYNINLKTVKPRLSCLTCCDLWHKNKLHIDYYLQKNKNKMEGLRPENLEALPSLFTDLFFLFLWALLVQILSWLDPDLHLFDLENKTVLSHHLFGNFGSDFEFIWTFNFYPNLSTNKPRLNSLVNHIFYPISNKLKTS